MRPKFDDRDAEILANRLAAWERRGGFRCGSFVRFPDGTLERMSYIWPHGAQTSAGGSWHLLPDGNCDFSGGLNEIIPFETLTLTDERRLGEVWFFHHDHAMAHNGVTAKIEFRVYTTTTDRRR